MTEFSWDVVVGNGETVKNTQDGQNFPKSSGVPGFDR